jgi:hypothetical protein
MNSILKTGLMAIVASAVFLSPASLLAQGQGGGQPPGGGQGRGQRGGGNFDPAQMQQRMMENMRERLGVKDDAEWKLISERIQKVMDVRRETAFGGMRGGMRGQGGGGPGGGGGGFGGASSPEADALAKAVEAKASKEELKAAMGKYREARKASQAKLEAAQEDLKKLLSVEQEATMLQMGMVN